jgi:hypothetical protein
MIGKTSENSLVFASDGRCLEFIAGNYRPGEGKMSMGKEDVRKFNHIHTPSDKYGIVVAGSGVLQVFNSIMKFFMEQYEVGLNMSQFNPSIAGRDVALGWTPDRVEDRARILRERFGEVNTGSTEVYACTIGTSRLVPLAVGAEYHGDPNKPNYGTIEWRFDNRFMDDDPFRASGSSQKAFDLLAKGRDSGKELSADFVKGLFAYALQVGEADQTSIGGRKYFAVMTPEKGYHEFTEAEALDMDMLAEEVRTELGE